MGGINQGYLTGTIKPSLSIKSNENVIIIAIMHELIVAIYKQIFASLKLSHFKIAVSYLKPEIVDKTIRKVIKTAKSLKFSGLYSLVEIGRKAKFII